MDKKTLKKQQIIKDSIDIMFKQGYYGTGVKELADAAGIPKGSLYNYFENKEDYLKEALIYYYEDMSKQQFDILKDRKLEPLERIKKFYIYLINTIGSDEEIQKGCFVGKITQEVSGVSELIQEVTDEIHRDIISILKSNIDEAIDENYLTSKDDTFALAEFIFSSWQGVLLRAKASKDKKTFDNFYKVLVEVLLK